MAKPLSYPVRAALLKVGVPCSEGFIYTADALEKVAREDEHLEFDGETLWYRNDRLPMNVTVTCRKCEQPFVTASDEPGECPRPGCGGARKPELV